MTLRINAEIIVVVSSPTRMIVGVVVSVGGIAVIAAGAVILTLQRKRRLQIVIDIHADETQPTHNDSYTNVCIKEVTATAPPTCGSEGEDPLDVYENTQVHPDRTYDTTCRPYEEHKYSDLQVMTTQGQNLHDDEERDRDIYYNVS